MSYGLTPIAVPLDSVRATIGSKDSRLLDRIALEASRRIASLDRGDDPDAEAEDRPIAAATSLRHLIMGEPCSRSWIDAPRYGYMFEAICDHFGEGLPNSEWCAMRGEWFDEVDEALEVAGVEKGAFRMVGRLVHRGMPVAIPDPDDFPSVGYLLGPEIGPARAALDGVDLPDREVRAAVDQARSWLATCAESGRDLVCFYY